MKKVLPLLLGLCLSPYALAENLLEVYEQAKLNNPELYSAAAQRDKAYAGVTGSRASLLPQLGLAGTYGANRGTRASDGTRAKTGNIALNLTQTVFDFSAWKMLSIAQKQATIQDMAYHDQEQLLMLNTSVAYFNVLNAIDSLRFLQAQKHAFKRQLDQTQQKFRVGLVAITDVQNVKANYDQTTAQLVAAHNTLNNNIENLRQVTGRFYSNLSEINEAMFKTARPEHVNQLLHQAESTNLSLIMSKLAQDLAKDQIGLAQAGHMPKLTVTASAGLSRNKAYGNYIPESSQAFNNKIVGQNSIALNLNFPIFTSGSVYAKVKEAQYNYVDYSEQLENTSRKVVNLVRSSYNNISAAVSSIQAYRQTVISAESSLKATESGYRVGTRTIVDVLSATTTLYSAKQQLSNAKYTYLISLLKMKYALGTLNVSDIAYLNTMLGKNVDTIIKSE